MSLLEEFQKSYRNRALVRRLAEMIGFVSPLVSEMTPNETKSVRDEMWTPDALNRLVEKYPEGRTFRSKRRRTARCLRTLHIQPGVVIAVMMEKTEGELRREYLFVKNGEQMKVNRLSPPNLEQESILDVLSILPSGTEEDFGKFLFTKVLRVC